jgi:hypothetical protein
MRFISSFGNEFFSAKIEQQDVPIKQFVVTFFKLKEPVFTQHIIDQPEGKRLAMQTAKDFVFNRGDLIGKQCL